MEALMRTALAAVLVCCVTAGALAAERGFELGLEVELETALELDRPAPTDGVQKSELRLEGELEADLGGSWRLVAIGRLLFDAEDDLAPGRTGGDAPLRALVGTCGELELRELYMEGSIGRSLWTLGKQQIVWGQADGLKVLDVVTPQDFREFILDDFDDSRIPLWAANVEIPVGESTLQLIWQPQVEPHLLPAPGAAYAFTSPRLVPQPPPGVEVRLEPLRQPQSFFVDSEWGLRLSRFWKGWDLSFNYLDHHEDAPVFERRIEVGDGVPLVILQPTLPDAQLLGGTASNAFGSLTLRSEVGYALDRRLTTNDLADADGVTDSDELSLVVGLDWFGVRDTLLSVQLFESWLVDPAPGLLRERVEANASFLYRRDLRQDTMLAEMLWIHGFEDDDGLVRPKLRYQWRDEIAFWVGADLFYGPALGLFGQFGERDRLVVGVEWSR